MSATGQGQPVRLTRRRAGRIAVVTLVFTVGIQLGDAAFHTVQELGEEIGRARSKMQARDPVPCLAVGNLTIDGLTDRLLGLFRLNRTEELAHPGEPDFIAQN